MNKYYEASKIRRKKQAEINSKVKNALSGLSPKTAKLNFDLSKDYDNQIDQNANARIKAIALVSDLLNGFNIPSKAKIAYLGMEKRASTDDGVIKDGIIKLQATITTLMGHKAAIEVPVIVKDKTLIEPAVFFYDGAPYVLCGPAIDDLIKRGSLEKDMTTGSMYSPNLFQKWIEIDKHRKPIINKDNMFSPGVRNPWTFKRYSQTIKDGYYNTEIPGYEIGWNLYILNGKYIFENYWKGDTEWLFDNLDPTDEGMEFQENATNTGINNVNIDEMQKLLDQLGIKFNLKEESETLMEAIEIGPREGQKEENDDDNYGKCEECGGAVTSRTPLEERFCPSCLTERTIDEADYNYDEVFPKDAQKEPRKRTNIDVPTEMPELWDEMPDSMLDPAERNREGLISVGADVVAQNDIEVRERGGAQLIIPSGEEGKVIKDVKGDGMCLEVAWPALDMSAIVYSCCVKQAGKKYAIKKSAQMESPEYVQDSFIFFPTHGDARLEVSGDEGTAYLDKTSNSWSSIDGRLAEKLNQDRWSASLTTDLHPVELVWHKSAANIDQIKNEIREMLRDGYQKIDVVTAIKKRYPEQADEAIQGLK